MGESSCLILFPVLCPFEEWENSTAGVVHELVLSSHECPRNARLEHGCLLVGGRSLGSSEWAQRHAQGHVLQPWDRVWMVPQDRGCSHSVVGEEKKKQGRI